MILNSIKSTSGTLNQRRDVDCSRWAHQASQYQTRDHAPKIS